MLNTRRVLPSSSEGFIDSATLKSMLVHSVAPPLPPSLFQHLSPALNLAPSFRLRSLSMAAH